MIIADVPDDQRAELVRLVRDAIAGEGYFLSPRMKRPKSLDPAPGPSRCTRRRGHEGSRVCCIAEWRRTAALSSSGIGKGRTG